MTIDIKNSEPIKPGGTYVSHAKPTITRLPCRFAAAVFLALSVAGNVSGAPHVSDHMQLSVPGAGPLTDLFTFPMPAPCSPAPCAEFRVMLAKFVVDEAADDLSFELRSTTSPVGKYGVVGFTTAGGGASVPVVDSDLGTDAASARARFVADPVPAGYRMLTLLVRFANEYESFPAGEIWKISANATATTDHYFGFRVDSAQESSAEPLVTKPHLIQFITEAQIPAGPYTALGNPYSIDFGEVHIGLADEFVPRENWEFRNIGTAALNITAVNPPPPLPAGAFTMENYPSPPLDVLPMNAFQRTVECNPSGLGPAANPAISLTTNAGALNLNLSATGIELRSAILMDLSGSMTLDKNNASTNVEEERKTYLARIAALELAELYNGILPQGRLGLYSYPQSTGNPTVPSSEQHISMSVVETNIQGYRNHLNANLGHGDLIAPANSFIGTPLAEGIDRVWGVLHPKPGNSRAAVFLMGDGEHNSNSAGPRPAPADWYNWATFQNAGIPFFTIPYGSTYDSWLQTFENLASESGGSIFPADITDDGELQTQFKKALGEVLDLETLKDPASHVNAGESKAHEICVSSSAYQLVFSVHWTKKDANALEVTVETPYHTLLTPATVAAHGNHVTYVSGETFKDYVVRGKFLSGDSGQGLWKIHIKGNQATDYVYQSYAMDRMKTQSTFAWGYIGALGNLKIEFAGSNYSVLAADAVAKIQRPTESFVNFLANTPVKPEDIARIPDTLARDWGPAEKKLYALRTFHDKTFDPKMREEEIRFGNLDPDRSAELGKLKQGFAVEDQRARGASKRAFTAQLADLAKRLPARTDKAAPAKAEYSLPITASKVGGYHTIAVSILGLNSKAECFEREFTFTAYLDVMLNSGLLTKALVWEEAAVKPFFPPELVKEIESPLGEGKERRLATFTLVDADGNKFGMGRAREIVLKFADAKPMGGLADNFDGSYSQLVEFSAGGNPSVTAAIGGVEGQSVPLKPGNGMAKPPWPWIVLLLLILILIFVIWFFLKRKP